MGEEKRPVLLRIILSLTIPSLVLVALYFTSLSSYLLFHSLAEIFSIIAAAGIFTIAWNSKELTSNGYILILGVAYLFVGVLDVFHTLTYKGMGIFESTGSNQTTQLWIAARYMQGITLLIAAFFTRRIIQRPYVLFSLYLFITAALIGSIFIWRIFPDSFIEPGGFTPFKMVSEYIISFVLMAAIFVMYKRRSDFEPLVMAMIIASIAAMIASELFFTLYADNVYGEANLIGHFLKIISFFFIYKAMIEVSLKRPYTMLFRDLKNSEEELIREKKMLEEALGHIKTLKGMLPICAGCKKIRDDSGYWNQIESYISDHSEAEFSHSICPECANKLYTKFLKIEA